MGSVETTLLAFDPDTASREEWTRYHRFRRARHREARPEDPVLGDASAEALMRQGWPTARARRFAVLRADAPDEQVGHLEVWVSQEGSPEYESNRHLAWLDLEVLGPYRRQGIGRRLLARIVDLAREEGKSVLTFETDEEDGKAFLAALGAEVKSRGRESRLHLERVDWGEVETWAREGTRRSPQTELRLLEGAVPEGLLEPYCRTLTETLNQQPFDALDHGDIVITPEVARTWEARLEVAGGTGLAAVTLEPDGEVSGLTDLWFFPSEAPLVHQGMTGVREAHRGHGLGKWLKAAALLHLREAHPELRVISTRNATSNAAMLSINGQLGFRPHRETVTAQMGLEELVRRLGQ